MLSYDPDIIGEKAERLDRQAIEVQIVLPALFLAAGLIFGLVAALLLSLLGTRAGWHEALSPRLLLIISALIFGFIGFLRGREEARELRFRAHTALCQLEMEKRLRKISAEG